jgi:hypothetical protein
VLCLIELTELHCFFTGTSRKWAVNTFQSAYSNANDCSRSPPKVVKSKNSDTPLRGFKRSVCSMQNLTESSSQMANLAPSDHSSKEDRSRSMEFLLDDEKNSHLLVSACCDL